MIPIGVAVAWAGYTVGIWGYCLVRGYDVPFTGLFRSVWPSGAKLAPLHLPTAPFTPSAQGAAVGQGSFPTPSGDLPFPNRVTGQA